MIFQRQSGFQFKINIKDYLQDSKLLQLHNIRLRQIIVPLVKQLNWENAKKEDARHSDICAANNLNMKSGK